MEQQLERSIEAETRENKKVNIKSLGIILSFAAIAILLLTMGFLMIQEKINTGSLERKISEMNLQLSNTVTSLAEVDKRTKPDENGNDIQAEIKSLRNSLYIMNVQHQIESGVITEDFVVEKALIIALPSLTEGAKGFLHMSIDMSIQPTMNSNYTGQGSFNLPDRELKSKIMDVINELRDHYSNEFHTDLPPFEDGTIQITVKNYEVGTFSEGTLKLKGE